MKINMIAAMATNRVVGQNNKLPWHYSQDLQHFKKITTGHTIVMGYNTFVSIGKPLPNRRNIVLSNEPIQWVETYGSIEEMMQQLEQEHVDQLFIIWGASVYQQFLPMADRIYLTHIKQAYEGDVYFPVFEDDFVQIEREETEEMDFAVYKRK